MSNPISLRDALHEGKHIWSIGVTDVAQAKLVEKVGFDAVAVQSYQLSLSQGFPDTGTITPEEIVRIVSRISRGTSLPIIVDFEQGFGDPYNTVYWTREFAKAGASALHIDDMGYPYMCPNIPPGVPDLEEETRVVGRIRAMKSALSEHSPLVIARTAANYCGKYRESKKLGMEEAVRRLSAYRDAGADILLVQGSTTAELVYFRDHLDGPLMTQTVADWSGAVIKSESIPLNIDELNALGYQIVNEAINIARLGLKAIFAGLSEEHSSRTSQVLTGKMLTKEEVDELMEIGSATDLRKRYG